MERRFTGFLIPILIATLVYLLFFTEDKKPADARPIQDQSLADPAVQAQVEKQTKNQFDPNVPLVRNTFGKLGEPGFQVTWSRYGAAIRSIALNDHYVDPTAAKRPVKELRDYYPIVPYYPLPQRTWGYGLVLEGRGKSRFKKAIDDGDNYEKWEVEDFKPGANQVRFFLDMGDGLVLEKIFRYEAGRRDIALDIKLVNKNHPVGGPVSYDVALRGVHLWNPTSEHLLGGNPAAAYGGMVTIEGDPVANRLTPGPTPQKAFSDAEGTFEYAGTVSRFFAGLIYPEDQAATDAVKLVTTGAWPPREHRFGPEAKILANSVPEVYCDLTLAVPPQGQATTLTYRLYLGPKSSSVFDAQENPDYARFDPLMDAEMTPACCCIPGMYLLSHALVWLLTAFHGVVGNWGVAIIMLTLIVRMILSPINFNMQRTMRAHGEKMKELKPKLDALNQRYKDDPKQLQAEMMKFNREHKLISAPLKGCAPMFLTMPIWFGLFTALRVMYELRGEPFFGYIDDLSRPDALFFLGWDLGLFEMPHFNLLPIIMVLLWLYLSMGTPLPKDPQQRQMMVMMRFMPILMGVMLYTYASGLMIYMCTSSVWGIIEQKVTKRILGPVNPDATGGMPNMPMV